MCRGVNEAKAEGGYLYRSVGVLEEEERVVAEETAIDDTTGAAVCVWKRDGGEKEGNARAHAYSEGNVECVGVMSEASDVLWKTQHLVAGDVGCDDGETVRCWRRGCGRCAKIPEGVYAFSGKFFAYKFFDVGACVEAVVGKEFNGIREVKRVAR